MLIIFYTIKIKPLATFNCNKLLQAIPKKKHISFGKQINYNINLVLLHFYFVEDSYNNKTSILIGPTH